MNDVKRKKSLLPKTLIQLSKFMLQFNASTAFKNIREVNSESVDCYVPIKRQKKLFSLPVKNLRTKNVTSIKKINC